MKTEKVMVKILRPPFFMPHPLCKKEKNSILNKITENISKKERNSILNKITENLSENDMTLCKKREKLNSQLDT